MSKKTTVEQVTNSKVISPTEAEALALVHSLFLLSQEAEAASDVKGQAAALANQLRGGLGNAKTREELVSRAVALANRA